MIWLALAVSLAFAAQGQLEERWSWALTLQVVGPTVTVIGTWLFSLRKLKAIHVLVNSQMGAAMAKIADLEARVGVLLDARMGEALSKVAQLEVQIAGMVPRVVQTQVTAQEASEEVRKEAPA